MLIIFYLRNPREQFKIYAHFNNFSENMKYCFFLIRKLFEMFFKKSGSDAAAFQSSKEAAKGPLSLNQRTIYSIILI